ncbi:RNA polymerase sigma factor, sigma-70 family protein (plasmid) [Clostridium baratii str. Sullivan]|uniref:RNA polymerase sigma factor, sigma-70 family protein n=1 Tax=Clostridium baratii str. Sullivan TaxID=1415775 RepID=A0A0A7G348_9CLOT|nr:helix-turn-helix domain-containing protein [Clostridium baratii]AIY85406.1 RNA polymerase sigma factor, sigma-70 family protein [Clostridium baratii str. Sullivan]
MGKRKISFEDIETIKNMYESGMSLKEIGELYEVSAETIKRNLGDKVANGKFRRASEKEKDKIYKEYLDGCATRKIAERYGLSYSTINTIINSRKKELLFIDELDKNIVNIIVNDYIGGKKVPDIAKEVNLSNRKVERILHHKKIRTLLNSVKAPYKIGYFNKLDNSKAYILGVMFSTYNIKNVAVNKYEITFTLPIKQVELLELIVDEVFLIKPTIIKSGQTSYLMKSRDVNLINDFKSFITNKGLNIPIEYQDAFIEGIFEKSANITRMGLTISCKDKIVMEFIGDYLMRRYVIKAYYKKPFVVIIYSKMAIQILLDCSDAIRSKVENSSYKNKYIT